MSDDQQLILDSINNARANIDMAIGATRRGQIGSPGQRQGLLEVRDRLSDLYRGYRDHA